MKEENPMSDSQIVKAIKMISYTIIAGVVLFAVISWLVFEKKIVLDPQTQYYVEIVDILLALLSVYSIMKWFRIPFLRKIFSQKGFSAMQTLQSMTVGRVCLWEGLCFANIVLYAFFGVANALYILAILALTCFMLIPTNANIQRNLELLSE